MSVDTMTWTLLHSLSTVQYNHYRTRKTVRVSHPLREQQVEKEGVPPKRESSSATHLERESDLDGSVQSCDRNRVRPWGVVSTTVVWHVNKKKLVYTGSNPIRVLERF